MNKFFVKQNENMSIAFVIGIIGTIVIALLIFKILRDRDSTPGLPTS